MEITPNKYNIRKMIEEFGLPLVLVASFSRVLHKIKAPQTIILKYESFKHSTITNYLSKKYKKSIKTEGFSNGLIEKDCPIWVCWWQGYDNAPSIVQSCIKSIYRNSGNHEVILITEENYKEYVEIPDYIIDKLKKGLITKIHFSDILRACLLAQHGGIWIDSTCYMCGPFPEFIYSRSYYTLKGTFKDWPWTDFFQMCGKSNVYMNNMMNAFLDYWSEHDQLLTYLLIDCFMGVMYRNIKYFKDTIDGLQADDFGIWSIKAVLDEPYEKAKFERIKEKTIISKLSYKEKRKDYIEGKKTFWKYLCEEGQYSI